MKALKWFALSIEMFRIHSMYNHSLCGLVHTVYYRRPRIFGTSRVVYAIPLLVLLFLSSGTKGEKWCSTENKQTESLIVFPFLLASEPIKRLLIIDFKDDPEYESFEPQFYSDPLYGNGLRVLLYRTDKKIDVYYQPGVIFNGADFTVGRGLGHAAQTKMSPSKFEIAETGVDLDIAFMDYKGRQIVLKVKENSICNKPFPFLAPVGNDVEKPSKLFLVYMQSFDFVKREGTVVLAKVGDKTLIPATFPIKRNGERVFFARYASNPAIGIINADNIALTCLDSSLDKKTQDQNHNYSFNQNNEVINYWSYCNSSRIQLSFYDGFPNLLILPQDEEVTGKWSYSVDDEVITGGTYKLLRLADSVKMEVNVTRKWSPQNLPFSFKLFTFFVKSFRAWPTTYRWEGEVDLKNRSVHGKWHRK